MIQEEFIGIIFIGLRHISINLFFKHVLELEKERNMFKDNLVSMRKIHEEKLLNMLKNQD